MSAELARRLGASLLAIVLIVLVWYAWRTAAPVAWLRAVIACALLLAALRPHDALFAVAGLAPLIGTFGAAQGSPLPARDAMLLATAAGWSIAVALRRGRLGVPSDLSAPAACFALVVATSMLTEFWGQRELLGTEGLLTRLARSIRTGLLLDRQGVHALPAALMYFEGLMMFFAVLTAATRRPASAARVVMLATAGAAGAGLLNLLRIVNASIAAEAPLQRLLALVATLRVNVHFADVNAAGSYFAMMFFPAAYLAVDGAYSRRVAWAAAAGVLFCAAWLTGSRAAVAAILAVAIAMLVAVTRRGTLPSRRTAAALAACLAAAVAFVVLFPNRLFGPAVSTAVAIRLEMARISLVMLARRPIFGVGVGDYYETSGPLLATSSLAGVYSHENAHNNLLQLAAEFGLAGMAVFVWLVAAVVARVWRSPASHPRMRHAVIAGLLAFGGTALVGHPLLTPEVSHAFWLMLGAVAGLCMGPAVPMSRSSRHAVATLVVCMLVTLPLRGRTEVKTLDLENVRYGVSAWMTDANGVKYQTFTEQATIFVPRNAAVARIPLREPGAGTRALVEVRIDGRLVDRVQTGSDWRLVRLGTQGAATNARFFRVDLVVPDGDAARNIQVGRLELH